MNTMAAELVRCLLSSDPADKQKGFGMMRVAELNAIAQVFEAQGCTSYVSVGCGVGHDLFALRTLTAGITREPPPTLAFDLVPVAPEYRYPGLEFHQVPIFDSAGISPFVDACLAIFVERERQISPGSRTLFYVDNGHKLSEMRAILPHMRSGDILGTHDYGIGEMTVANTITEVPESECTFLYEAGLRLFEPIESWIQEHRCIQRFWYKI